MNFDLQIDQSMQGATVTLSTTSPGSTINFNGLDQIGLGRSICTTTRNSKTGSSTGKVLTVDKTTSLSFNSASTLTITCERQMSGDGKGGLFADAQTLVFNTSAGSYQVPMVTIGLLPRVSIEQAVSIVNSQIAQVKTSVDAFYSQGSQQQNSINTLSSQISSLQKGTSSSSIVTYSTLQKYISSCNGGNGTDCIAAAHRYCNSQGFAGGFFQEWGASDVNVVCVK